MKRMMWILVVAGWAAAQTVTVVEIVDASRSFAPMAAESKNEQRQMVEAMPAGAHFVVLSVGNSVRRIFDGDLNPARKTEALRQIAAIPATDFNTDLGAALEDAQASLDGLGGRRMIWISRTGEMNRRKAVGSGGGLSSNCWVRSPFPAAPSFMSGFSARLRSPLPHPE